MKLQNKVVLVRVDINSSIDPMTNKILDDTRIRTHAGTIKELSESGAKVVVLAHQQDLAAGSQKRNIITLSI